MVKTDITRIGNDENGMALIAVLVILMAVALMGIGLSSDTSMNIRIAGYEKYKLISFGYSESSLYATTDVLEDNIMDAGWQNDNIVYPYVSFFSAIGSGNSIDISEGDFYMSAGDVVYTGVINSTVAVNNQGSILSDGSAIQMAAGYEGIGKSAGGAGVHIIYGMTGEGKGSTDTKATLGIDYRHLTK